MASSPPPFLDTNITLYSIKSDDRRYPTAAAIVRAGGTISVQVLNEFANVARRKLKLTWEETNAAPRLIRLLCKPCLPITVETHSTATSLAARFQLAFYDALIVASALEANCTTLLTEDLTHGQIIDSRLTIQNPFTSAN